MILDRLDCRNATVYQVSLGYGKLECIYQLKLIYYDARLVKLQTNVIVYLVSLN